MADTEARVLLVDSRDRISGTSDSFRIELNEPYNVLSYSVIGASIPTQHNITAGNNQLVTSYGTVNLTAGSYSGTELAAALQTALIVFDATSLVTYTVSGANAGKFRIQRGTAFSILFATNPSTIRQTLGFNATDLTLATNYTSQGIASLSVGDVYIASEELTGGGGGVLGPDAVGLNPRTIIQKVGTVSSFGGVTVYDSLTARERRHVLTNNGRNVRQWDFSFYTRALDGSSGYTLASFGGAPVSLELLVTLRRQLY